MKKLQKLSLLKFSQAEMEKQQLNAIRGGRGCPMDCNTDCPCLYAGEKEGPDDAYYGGASTNDNQSANAVDCFDWFSNSAY